MKTNTTNCPDCHCTMLKCHACGHEYCPNCYQCTCPECKTDAIRYPVKTTDDHKSNAAKRREWHQTF